MRYATTGLLLALLLAAVSGVARGQPRPSLEDVKRAWQQRQDAIKSLKVVWAETRTLPKGYFDIMTPGTKDPSPPTDVRLPGRGVMTLDDRNCRFEIKRSHWVVESKKLEDVEEINVYKDGKNTALTTKSPIDGHPNAEINAKSRPGDVMEFTYWPVTCFARGLNPTFAPVAIDDYELTGKSQAIDGRRCVELVHKSRAGKVDRFLLLDPERGYVLVRYYTVIRDRVTLRLDVRYAPDPVLGWAPKSWDYAATTPTGIRLESKQVTQEGWEVNGGVGGDAFKSELPPGTRVFDASSGVEKQYVIKDNGEPGPSIPDSQRPTYEQLADAAKATWSPVPWVVAGAVLVVLACSVLVVRRRRRAGKGSGSPQGAV